VRASDEIPGTRLTNISTRGFVGPGNQVLIEGLVINGPDPVRMLITVKGPSLSAFGVTGALADPSLAIYDSAGRQIAANDNVGTPAAGSELAIIPACQLTPRSPPSLSCCPRASTARRFRQWRLRHRLARSRRPQNPGCARDQLTIGPFDRCGESGTHWDQWGEWYAVSMQ